MPRLQDLATVALACAALIAAPALAQGGPPPGSMPPPPATLDAAARAAVVAAAATTLRDAFAEIDTGDAAASAIEAKLATGDYDDLTAPAAFAEQLTADLYEVTHDKHLRVSPLSGPVTPVVGMATTPTPPRSAGGIVRADRLIGNVGYIEVTGFPDLAMFKLGADPALRALADTRALVIDVRRNGGGSPPTVAYLESYFIDADEPVLISEFVNRNRGADTFTTLQSFSVATPFTYLDKPIYVLTSAITFSGAEQFAYEMQAMKLAVIVGETTLGGASLSGLAPLASGFAMAVPFGRPRNPITNTSWEGVGVVPDIAAPADEALQVVLAELGLSPDAPEVDALSVLRVFTPRVTAQPGSEAALRRHLAEFASGEPDYDLISPQLGQMIRQQLPGLRAQIEPLGAVESVIFREIDPQGADVYDVTFANGALVWNIVLDADGKTVTAGFRPVLPGSP